MTSFFKNLKTNFSYYNREIIIKENLVSQLSENAKQIQFEFSENEKECLELSDCTNSLCTTLEAIFLHGLKDSFLWQTLSVISGTDVDRRPEPNFWPLLMVFLHAHTIEQIENLSQITTEIGNCRCWIRLSLNESLFSSYMNNIRKNSSALNPYYKNYAFLKDSDNMDVVSKILEGIETCVQINLPINSSLLNQWTNLPLQMAGLWTPPLRSCPIASGIDVASSILDDTDIIPVPKPLQTNELFSESISNSPFSHGPSMLSSNTAFNNDLSENENFQIFLQKIDAMEEIAEEENLINDDNERNKLSELSKDEKSIADDLNSKIKINSENLDEKIASPKKKQKRKLSTESQKQYGNLVNVSNGWSDELPLNLDRLENNNQKIFELETSNNNFNNKLSRSSSLTTSISSLKSPIDRYSYDTLLIKHEKHRIGQQIDLNDVWERFENSLLLTGETARENVCLNDDVEHSDDNTDDDDPLDFEILPKSMTEKFTLLELRQMVDFICKLGREQGLDAQGFVCISCAHPLGIGFANAQVCSFSGNYFCEQCISQEQFIIPAKVIYNWDFRKYTVSKRAAAFLTEFQYQPFIDLKILNPDIYQASEEMAALQSLRIQLNFIRAYLYTCCDSSIEALQQQIASKEYLYEHIHQYSIADILMIPRGQLAHLLQKTFQFGEQHVLKCNLCSVKGFICEICNSPKVLYPFHLNTTYRCEICSAVFHDQCLNQSKPCPKCERKRKREDLPLLEAVHML